VRMSKALASNLGAGLLLHHPASAQQTVEGYRGGYDLYASVPETKSTTPFAERHIACADYALLRRNSIVDPSAGFPTGPHPISDSAPVAVVNILKQHPITDYDK